MARGASQVRWFRGHLLESLEMCLFSAYAVCFYLDGAFLLLVVRCLCQVQLAAGHVLHPNRSLRFFGIACGTFNIMVVLQHLVLGARPKRINFLVDFIGQDYAANRLQILLFDILVAAMQLCYVAISYDEWHDENDMVVVDRRDPPEDSEEEEREGESFGLLSSPRHSRRPEIDYLSRPIVRLSFSTTAKRLFVGLRKPAAAVGTPTEGDRLTPRGARHRARRRRREGFIDEERLAEASDEERDIGV